MTQEMRLTDRKRAAIMTAAIAEFRAHGFDATSMDRIAAAACVSKRTVYNHFASKDELFAEMLVQLWQRSLLQAEEGYDPARPLAAQLQALMQAKMRMLNDPSFMDLARVAIAETIHSPERARDMVARLGEREESVLVWIRAAAADGRLKEIDPVLASQQLQALIKAFAFWPQITMGQPPLDPVRQQRVIDDAVSMFLARYAQGD